jgi:hypothetical protein
MQMRFSRYIILSFSSITFINLMIRITVYLLLSRTIKITKIPLPPLGLWIPPFFLIPPLNSFRAMAVILRPTFGVIFLKGHISLKIDPKEFY